MMEIHGTIHFKLILPHFPGFQVHSAAHSGRWCGGPAAAVRFKQRPKLVSYIRAIPHRKDLSRNAGNVI